MSTSILIPRSGKGAPTMQAAVKGRSLWDDARRRLFRNKAAVAGMIVLALLVLAAIVGPHLTAYTYDEINKDDVWLGPMRHGHLIGTDSLGRDLLARLLMGLRVSLAIGLIATFVSLVIGVVWGAVAGFVGGRLDEVMMRFVDVLYSLPFIFFVILLMVTFGSNIILIFVAIGAVEWLTMSRIVRGQTLTLKQKEFVEAARAAGLSQGGIIFRHIVPNVVAPYLIMLTSSVGQAILLEASLSFLGLGVTEPTPAWGPMLSGSAIDFYQQAPWMIVFPGVAISLAVFAFNLFGDSLRDWLDPRIKI